MHSCTELSRGIIERKGLQQNVQSLQAVKPAKSPAVMASCYGYVFPATAAVITSYLPIAAVRHKTDDTLKNGIILFFIVGICFKDRAVLRRCFAPWELFTA